jgi:hypothetical protein
MDYTDPANRRLRDEPTLPLSPEEAQIAAALYSNTAFGKFVDWLNNSPTNTTTRTNEEENPRRHN